MPRGKNRIREGRPVAGEVGHLQDLGFSEVEARVYLAVLGAGPLTGYQAARAAGIQRPNVYPALERLELRGAIGRVPGPSSGMLYTALPFDQLAGRLAARQRQSLDAVRQALAMQPQAPRDSPALVLAGGYRNLLDALRDAIARASRSLIIALCPPEAAAVGDLLSDAQGRDVAVSVLCLTACEPACGHCPEGVVCSELLAGGDAGLRRWAVALRDCEEAVIGEVTPPDDAVVITSRQSVLLALAAGFLAWVGTRGTGAGSAFEIGGDLLAGLARFGTDPREQAQHPEGD